MVFGTRLAVVRVSKRKRFKRLEPCSGRRGAEITLPCAFGPRGDQRLLQRCVTLGCDETVPTTSRKCTDRARMPRQGCLPPPRGTNCATSPGRGLGGDATDEAGWSATRTRMTRPWWQRASPWLRGPHGPGKVGRWMDQAGDRAAFSTLQFPAYWAGSAGLFFRVVTAPQRAGSPAELWYSRA